MHVERLLIFYNLKQILIFATDMSKNSQYKNWPNSQQLY